jgi:putative Holliday junction resolvase
MPGTPETILSFDFGLRRIGVAVGQQVTNSANPLCVVSNGDDGPDWDRIGALVREWQPARLIVGMPVNADGSPSEIGNAVSAFIEGLGRFELPVEAVDERYSSMEAEALLKSGRRQGLRGRIGKETIDAAAATLIAERWLKKDHQ